MATNSFLQKKGFGFGKQDNANFPEHQELRGAGQYSHNALDNYMERLVATDTRYVQIATTRVLSLDNQSDIAFTDLDLSSYLTPRTMAVILRLSLRDSGSAASAGVYFQVRKNGDTGNGEMYLPAQHINDDWTTDNGICKCDSNQIIEYNLNASGAGTADIDIDLLGYFEGTWHYQQEE